MTAIDLEMLLHAYANGYFPMADSRDDPDIMWIEPKMRAILPLDGLKISKSLAKTIRQDKFRMTSDTEFAKVISLCAEAAEDRRETWINTHIEEAFLELHALGYAHSVEAWRDGEGGAELVGGLYGIALGGVFCGESMFSRASDASKVALAWLVARLRMGGFQLLDCQFMTDHLASLGATEIPQSQYLDALEKALIGNIGMENNGAENKGLALNQPIPANQSDSTVCSSGVASSSGSSSSSAASLADWGALDGFLTSGLAVAELSAGRAAVSSPGKRILHSLTQIS